MTKKQAQELLQVLREIKQTLESLRGPQFTYTYPPSAPTYAPTPNPYPWGTTICKGNS